MESKPLELVEILNVLLFIMGHLARIRGVHEERSHIKGEDYKQ